MRKSTITDLPKDIKSAIPEWESKPKLKEIIAEAEAGEFHDYKNKKYACGKVQSHAMLTRYNDPRLTNIIEAIANGAYDEEADAEDIEIMRKDWLANGGTEETFKVMFGG